MFVGIDDTDSPHGMCTTYLCALILRELRSRGIEAGMPRLIRLNPNIPYKTRGNGAVSFQTEDSGEVRELVVDYVRKYQMRDANTNSGVVFLSAITGTLESFALRCLHEVLTIEEGVRTAEENGEYVGFGNKRGLIGALAACAMPLPEVTYELLAYRKEENWGKERVIDERSVKEMDGRFFPETYNNYDYLNRHVCIAPSSPDPVLLGVRGNEDAVQVASRMVRSEEPAFTQLFLTNQGTDMHLTHRIIAQVREYESVIVEGTVSRPPTTSRGGHVSFDLRDGESEITCLAYEPTKQFRNVVRLLDEGDRVASWGAVKRTPFGLTLALEKLEVLSVHAKYTVLPPVCSCGKKMESEGKGKGYRCRGCHTKAPGIEMETFRMLWPGFYEAAVSARRHLSKPLARYAMDYKQALVTRRNLKLSRGKLAAQCAHGALEAADMASDTHADWYKEWRQEGQRKVVLEVAGEKELIELFMKAKKASLPATLIRDAGLTEIPPNTATVVAIGPAPEKLVDELCGKLKLL